MLKRQNDDIFHTLERRRAARTGKALSDDDPDPTMCVPGIPIDLFQDLAVEGRKAKSVLVAVPIDMRAEL